MNTLTIADLNLDRGGQAILSNLNLEVLENEILGLVGNSGCGKTSLLYAIAGVLPIKSGELLWQGQNITDIAPHKRRYGLVFQDHLLFPHKTVSQNLSFGLKVAKWEKDSIKNRVGELLELLGLVGFGDRSVQSLSGGQAQRVSLGRALAPKPSLLMLDEPLAALDQTLRDTLATEIRDIIKQQEIPAIYVTHDLNEVFFVADRLALMTDGGIHRVDKSIEMRNNPKDSYTASFFGLENQFDVTILESGALVCPWNNDEHKYAHTEHNLATNTSRILVLPEDIEVWSPNTGAKDKNTAGKDTPIPAKVTNLRFLGSRYLVELVILSSDNSQLKLTMSSKFALEVGSECQILLNPATFLPLTD